LEGENLIDIVDEVIGEEAEAVASEAANKGHPAIQEDVIQVLEPAPVQTTAAIVLDLIEHLRSDLTAEELKRLRILRLRRCLTSLTQTTKRSQDLKTKFLAVRRRHKKRFLTRWIDRLHRQSLWQENTAKIMKMRKKRYLTQWRLSLVMLLKMGKAVEFFRTRSAY